VGHARARVLPSEHHSSCATAARPLPSRLGCVISFSGPRRVRAGGISVTVLTGWNVAPGAALSQESTTDLGEPMKMRASVRQRALMVAAAHVVLALVHVYWATGATWPTADTRSLSNAVLGGEASFAPRVVLPLAALHLVAAVAVTVRATRARSTRGYTVSHLVVLCLVAGVAARAALGVLWTFGIGTDPSSAFYWLNLLLYTPAAVLLVLADLSVLRHGARVAWPRRAALAVPVVLVTALGGAAYGYQPEEQPRRSPSAHSQYIDTPMARFHYLRQGSGSPVVLLSPGAAPTTSWQPQLDALSRHHTVYVVDLPGQGHTELHDRHFRFDLDAMVGAVGAFLDAAGLRTVALAGNSWSGGWGLAYAQRHPERVERLVLLAPSGLADRDPASWELLKLPLVGELLAKLGTGRSTVEASVKSLFVHQERVTPELVDAMWVAGTFRDNVRSLYALERGLDWRVSEAALPDTRQPTLVVWGAQDAVLPATRAARFGASLPAATVVVLDGCGHGLTRDCPDRVTGLMEDFLA
jgi:pimeloyl-ACP methyl ester carboxylesterase